MNVGDTIRKVLYGYWQESYPIKIKVTEDNVITCRHLLRYHGWELCNDWS